MTTSMERLSAGTEVRAWVSAQARGDRTWVRAHGMVRDVVVAIDDVHGAREVLRTTDAAWLASLDAALDSDGEVQSAVVTTLAAGVPVTVAGRLVSAIAVDVVARVEHLGSQGASVGSPAPVVATRPAPSSASAPVSAGPRPMPAPVPTRTAPAAPQAPRATASPVPVARPQAPAPAAAVSSWAAVSAASERIKAGASDEPEPIELDELERGDLLMHPTLGRCTFLQTVDTDAIKVKLGNGSPQKLMMRVFDVLPTDTARVFKLRKRE